MPLNVSHYLTPFIFFFCVALAKGPKGRHAAGAWPAAACNGQLLRSYCMSCAMPMNYYVYAVCPRRKRKSGRGRGGIHAAVAHKFNEIATVFICNDWAW